MPERLWLTSTLNKLEINIWMLAVNTDHKLREGQWLGGQRLPRIMNKQDITKCKGHGQLH